MEELAKILRDFCLRIGEAFFRAYGKPESSSGRDVVLPVDTQAQWIAVITIPTAAVVTVYNSHATNELMITFNPGDAVGARVPAGDGRTYDAHRGVLYAKSSDPTLVSSINVLVTGLWV